MNTTNTIRTNEVKRRYFEVCPWARKRASSAGNAKRKGLEHTMTTADFKELWFRDKAYLLKEPSIDRIDPKKGYIKENCRYIELRLNQSLGATGSSVAEHSALGSSDALPSTLIINGQTYKKV